MHSLQEKLLKVIDSQNIGILTLREIGTLVGEKLPQKVKHHLSQLERKGFILHDRSARKIIRLTEAISSEDIFVSIPIVGAANCGPMTIYADQNIEGYLKISKRLINNKQGLYAVQAQGNSLNRANIQGKNIDAGDFIIVDSENTSPRDGDYIVTIIDGLAIVKKFRIEKNYSRIALVSESTQDYTPIFLHAEDNFVISGKVVDVVKKYQF